MNRSVTALFAALEALLVVAIGIGIPLAPLTILWAFQYGLQVDWIVFWRASADIWLLGSGVDVRMTLHPAIATALGFPTAGDPFVVTIALLGFGLLTVLLGARAGRRIGETPHNTTGIVAAIATFGILSLAITLSTLFAAARPSIWQGALLPTAVFALGVGIGVGMSARSRGPYVAAWGERHFRAIVEGWSAEVRAIVSASLRAGAAAGAIVVAASAIIVSALFLVGYAKIISLYEGLHAGVIGGIALTIGQLSILPNLVVWTSSWLVGPGFALGTGSSVSPFGTSVGPIPAIPVFGALPAGDFALGYLGLLVPVLAGFLVALVVRPGLVRATGRSRGPLVVAGIGIGVVGGIALGLLTWFSAGAAGPGRLVDVGPSPWLVAAFAALEIAIPAIVALLVGRPRSAD
jgi:hypothetical protein